MSDEILRDFTLVYNLEDSKVTSESGYITFYNTDENISTLFVKLQAMNSSGLLSFLKVLEATNHSLTLTVRKPLTNEKVDKVGVLQSGEDDDIAIFRFDLPSKFTNQAGECIGELLDSFTENGINKKATSETFQYRVKASYMKDLTEEPQGSVEIPVTIYDDETKKEESITITNSDIESNLTLEEVDE